MVDADAAASALVSEYDANDNSAIDGAELRRVPAIQSALDKYDANRDGQVTADEIKTRIKSWEVVPVASMPLHCTVRLGRNPLPNATVVLEPEAPFKDQLHQAMGTTDRGGYAQLSMKLDDDAHRFNSGVQCGLYKVRITAPLGGGRELPSKYNAQTQLGLEVAPDAPFMRDGLRFDL